MHPVNPSNTFSSLWALPLAVGLAACGATETINVSDSGARPDAAAADAGEVDAGAADTGMMPVDAGQPPIDAGEPPTDGGAMDVDAGTVLTGPIVAPDETWTWVDFPEAKCINGSETGIGVNIKPGSTKVMIFMMGGNACFNQASCFATANLDGYNKTKFDQEVSQVTGTFVFDRSEAENLFKDYSFVFVPYCTGDVHAGSKPQGTVGGSAYTFTGYDNVGAYLERLVPTFSDATEVILSGSSAGGFGAMLNYKQVQSAFGPNVNVTLIDDSGPAMGSEYISPCLQQHFRDTWGYDDGVLADCVECAATTDGSFIEPYFDNLMALYPDRNFAVISSDGDQVIRGFWAFGQNDCRNINDIFPPAYPVAKYLAGLEDFRDNIALGLPNVGLYLKTGTTRHVWLNSDPRTVTQDGVTLDTWLRQALGDDPTWDHVPPGM